jgi:mRNA interferase MazF
MEQSKKSMPLQQIKRGEIYWANLDPTIGAEIKKTRPVLVVSNNINNTYSPLVTILPISSNVKNPYPYEVLVEKGIAGLKNASIIKANQIKTIDKKRINGQLIGFIDNSDIMEQVNKAIKIHLHLY